MTPAWLTAGFWGFVAGAALLIGAAIGYWLHVPQRLVAAIMAFGNLERLGRPKPALT